MVVKVLSLGLLGMDAYPIEIEVDVSWGLPTVTIVGMADTCLKESKERVKTAIKNSGYSWPAERITINLAPSDIKKEGACFDLAIALGVLAATEQIPHQNLDLGYILGELSLNGSLRPVQGALPMSLAACRSPKKTILLPCQNANEAALARGIAAFAVNSLNQAVEFLNDPARFTAVTINQEALLEGNNAYDVDFSEVKGQFFAKRALEVAVAGGHHALLIGPPGSGKSMLAKRMLTIMPDLTLEEILEITKVHSVAGTLLSRAGIIKTRPFRSPHHCASDVALIGGGSFPKPGEISLAHKGVLFLDELPEFRRNALEALRQPLEDGLVRISRIHRCLTFPASFMLVCAMNPCPCGYYTDPRKACRCGTNKVQHYLEKISGPLLDRIDIHIDVPAVKYQELTDTRDAESSATIKIRIEKARFIQRKRLADEHTLCNASMNARLIRKYCVLKDEAKELLKMAMNELKLSARAYDKILKISRTIADLASSDTINTEHISEAIQYRSLDRKL